MASDFERTRFALNHRLIEKIEEYSDTIITLSNDHKYSVTETTNEIIEKIIAFEQNVNRNPQTKRSGE